MIEPLTASRPAIHLSGIPRDALETTFNGGRPSGLVTVPAIPANHFFRHVPT
jgi:hypothetical protein